MDSGRPARAGWSPGAAEHVLNRVPCRTGVVDVLSHTCRNAPDLALCSVPETTLAPSPSWTALPPRSRRRRLAGFGTRSTRRVSRRCSLSAGLGRHESLLAIRLTTPPPLPPGRSRSASVGHLSTGMSNGRRSPPTPPPAHPSEEPHPGRFPPLAAFHRAWAFGARGAAEPRPKIGSHG